jgi:PKD repeat protein
MRLIQATILILLLSPVHAGAGPIFDYQALEDDTGDAFNYKMCFFEGVLVPQPMELDVTDVEITAIGLDPPEIALEVTLATPPLPHMSYTVELGLDTDQDPSTGASQPAAYYNGLGVDLRVGMAVEPGAESTWVERYEGGVWLRVGETRGSVEGVVVLVYIPLDLVAHPLDADGVVYLVSGGGLDMVPGVPLLFHYAPDAELTLNPPLVEEGSTCLLDASGSTAFYGVARVDWDVNGDGVYEEAGASITAAFPGDGTYAVTVRVTDAEGFVDTRTRTVTVLNLPPAGLEAGYTGEAKPGNTLTFTAEATDPGGDPLTYRWSFGDDSTGQGAEATHAYTGAGFYVAMVTATDDAGAETTAVLTVEVAPPATQPPNGGGAGAPPVDPLLIILVAFFGVLGFWVYRFFKGKKKEEGKAKPPEGPKGPGDYCKEHPEVVEAEKKACDDAQWDLDQALGPIEEKLDKYRQEWREMGREIGRLLMEWDTAFAVIQSLTKSEKAIKKSSETVQKVAGIVKPGGGMAKKAFKEGGEAAMKELGKHVATEVGKGIAGEVSSTVGDLLGLEEWAMGEIGIGIAKLMTGIDPKKEASDLRKKSMETCTQLQSWVDSNLARTTRFTSTTLQSSIEDAERLKADIDKALQDFENRVAGFKCVKCKVDPGIMEHIRQMQDELDGFIRAFGDMIDQIQQRLSQAAAMFSRKDVYDSPYVWSHEVNNFVPEIKKTLKKLKK